MSDRKKMVMNRLQVCFVPQVVQYTQMEIPQCCLYSWREIQRMGITTNMYDKRLQNTKLQLSAT